MASLILALLALTAGLIGGFMAGTKYRIREMPTVQEQIDAVMKLGTPATGDDLLRLMEQRMVMHAGAKPWHLELTVGPCCIKTPDREHLALLVQDIPGFEAMVAAAKAAMPEEAKKS